MSEWLLSAPTLFGLESLAAREIRDLGYHTDTVEDGRVTFRGGDEAVCRCNLWLRTAERVQIKMGDFAALTFDSLFEQVKALQWHLLLPGDAVFPVNGHSLSSKLFSVPDCQAIIKKAIVEAMKRQYGGQRCPESGKLYRIQFNIIRDRVTLYVDTSGEGLHKRGYRTESNITPIKETLAAALVKLSGWRPGQGLWDPFCGSGTIVIEAAMMAANVAPGLNRSFAAEGWTPEGKKLWDAERARALAARRDPPPGGSGGERMDTPGGGDHEGPACDGRDGAGDSAADRQAGAAKPTPAPAPTSTPPLAPAVAAAGAPLHAALAGAPSPSAAPVSLAIVGSDLERRSVAIARSNAKRAGVSQYVRFFQLDAKDMDAAHPRFRELGIFLPASGAIVCNPPYGERLKDARDAEVAIKEWAPALKSFMHWKWNIISAQEHFEKNVGRAAGKRRKLYNGMIKCYCHMFFPPKDSETASGRA